MTSCPLTPHPRSPRFHSEAEVVAVELAHLVLVAHRDRPDPRVTQVPLALPDLRAMLVNADQKVLGVFRVLLVLLDPLVPPEQMDNPDPRAMSVPLALRDLLENAVLPVRMRLPRSSTSTSPRTRQPRPTARRLMLKTHSDRPTHSRMVPDTTLR